MTHGNVDTMQQSRRPYFLNGRCYSCRRLYIFDYHYSPVTCTSHTEALECQNETNKKMRSPSSSTLSRHARRQTQMKYKKTTEEYASQTEFMVTPFPLNGERESSFTLNCRRSVAAMSLSFESMQNSNSRLANGSQAKRNKW